MYPSSRHLAGFTLMELLIAVSLTVLMLFLFNQVFDSTRQLISQGTARGDAIANSSGIDSTMRRDVDNMVGPHDNTTGLTAEQSGGFLAIVQARFWAPLEGPQNTRLFRQVRSDQLVFISKRQRGQTSIAPAADTAFAAPNDADLARYIRVWYGHGLRTEADGGDTLSTPDAVTDIDFPGYPGGLNGFANDWILCRQALMLGEVPIAPQVAPDDATDGWAHAEGAYWDALVADISPSGGMDNQLFAGLTDYAYYSLDDAGGYTGVPGIHPYGAIVGSTIADIVAPGPMVAGRRLWSDDAMYTSPDSYRLRAVNNYTFIQKRLRVNPVPDPLAALSAAQIAQIHPYMMEHCSDFAVEFAADIYDNGSPTATIAPDGQIDTVDTVARALGQTVTGGVYTAGGYNYAADSIAWYTGLPFANNVGSVGGFNPSQPLTFPAPAAYDAYEDFSGVGGAPANAGIAFVWRHDDEPGLIDADADGKPEPIRVIGGQTDDQPSLWPSMLRVRFKLHDARGQLQAGGVAQWQNDGLDNDWDGRIDENNQIVTYAGQDLSDTEVDNGVWFEQIIPVNRPPVPAP